MGSNNQYRLLWSGISRSKRIKQIQGDRWLRLGCHLVYSWLLPWADDDGRLIGDPLWVLANVVPNEGLSQPEIQKILIELHRVNLIYWYEVESEYFIQINKFPEHQRIRQDRYKSSSYPPCQPDVGQVPDNGQPDVGLSPSPSPSPSPSSDSIEYRLADYLLNFILKRNPNHKKPNIQSWAKHIDLMIRIDKRKVDDIKAVIKWCQNDTQDKQQEGNWKGWANNILSTKALRDKFDKIYLQMAQSQPKISDPITNQPPIEEMLA